jgi:hypothetical protein
MKEGSNILMKLSNGQRVKAGFSAGDIRLTFGKLFFFC